MLKIEFLYYDKTVCKRCFSTDKSVKLTLRELKKVIKDAKVQISFKERKLPQSKIHLSPTILINGKDIEKLLSKNSKLKSNTCSDCCQLIGHSVNCRTFNYKGKNYDYIPKEMIREAINLVCAQNMNKEVDEYIEKQKSPQKEILKGVRKLILKNLPGCDEKMAWGVPVFAEGKFYIGALKNSVHVGFAINGLSKKETDLFEGSGKTMRHIKIYSLEGLDEKKLTKLIRIVNKKVFCKSC